MSSRARILRGGRVDAWRPAPAGAGGAAGERLRRDAAPGRERRPAASGPLPAAGPAGGAAVPPGERPLPVGAAAQAAAQPAARAAEAVAGRLAALEAERDALRRRVAELERAAEAARAEGRAAEEAWRGAAVDLAVAVARRLLRRELSLHPEEVVRLAAEVLDAAAPAARDFRLAACPGDADLLAGERERLAARLAGGARLEIVSDERLDRGDLVLETPAGTWDARLETGLEELAAAARGAGSGGGEGA